MKKTLIALAVAASAAVSGSAIAWQDGDFNGSVDIGGSITSDQPTWQWKIGNMSADAINLKLNRPGFPGECFICELRLPDHRFRWKHNKLFLLLPVGYGPAFPAIVDCYTSPPT